MLKEQTHLYSTKLNIAFEFGPGRTLVMAEAFDTVAMSDGVGVLQLLWLPPWPSPQGTGDSHMMRRSGDIDIS